MVLKLGLQPSVERRRRGPHAARIMRMHAQERTCINRWGGVCVDRYASAAAQSRAELAAQALEHAVAQRIILQLHPSDSSGTPTHATRTAFHVLTPILKDAQLQSTPRAGHRARTPSWRSPVLMPGARSNQYKEHTALKHSGMSPAMAITGAVFTHPAPPYKQEEPS